MSPNFTLMGGTHVHHETLPIRLLQRFFRMRYQLLSGIIIGVLLPFLLRSQGVFGSNLLDYQNSTFGTFAALLIGFVIMRKMTALPGSSAYINVLPAYLISYGIVMVIFFGFRLDYSRYQFLTSFVLTVSWFFIVMVVLRRVRRPAFGIIAGGRTDHLITNTFVDTVVLRSVADAEANTHLPLVADFLNEGLSDEWERYLAEQAVRGRSVYNARQLIESLEGKVRLEHLSENSLGLLSIEDIYRPAKKYIDAVAAAIVLTFISPLLLAVGLAIRLDSPGPALFRQERVGFRGKTFTVYKFRSMRVQEEPETPGLEGDMTASDDHRITRIGRILRKTRIDELPQLINVLRGEMSWIGPRPETLRLSVWYEKEIPLYRIRHLVRPGITGWAQVRQGHVTSVEDVREKLRYDLFYVKHFSVWFDVLIVIHTIRVLLTGKGAK